MSRGHCILSHGFESGPDATKVTALAEVAERLGWTHERPDYTDLDALREVSSVGDVRARLQRLVERASAAAGAGGGDAESAGGVERTDSPLYLRLSLTPWRRRLRAGRDRSA